MDTLILGCTHFPLLTPLISRVMGDGVTLINAGKETAAACAEMLQQRDMLAQEGGGCRFLVSDRPEGFTAVAEMFLGRQVSEDIERVNVEGLA